jgi:hypothetical protein
MLGVVLSSSLSVMCRLERPGPCGEIFVDRVPLDRFGLWLTVCWSAVEKVETALRQTSNAAECVGRGRAISQTLAELESIACPWLVRIQRTCGWAGQSWRSHARGLQRKDSWRWRLSVHKVVVGPRIVLYSASQACRVRSQVRCSGTRHKACMLGATFLGSPLISGLGPEHRAEASKGLQ